MDLPSFIAGRLDTAYFDRKAQCLDPEERRQFLEQIIEVASDGNRSVVFSSHIVSDVERLANKIWILKDQRMYWQGDFDSLKDSIVRLHARASRPLPASLAFPNALNVQLSGTTATAVVQGWRAEMQAGLAQQLEAEIEVEQLTLEDIFLELHR
jgi:ABC-2 type transport system ATP-binding protein